MKKEQIIAPLGLGLAIIIFISSIYFSSARFAQPPTIVLPDEYTILSDSYHLENKFIYDDIMIDLGNYKDVISKLSRPINYSFDVNNTVFSQNLDKTQTSQVTVLESQIDILRDKTKIVATSEYVTFSENTSSHSVSRTLYTNDELIGIPTYEDLLSYDFNATEIIFETINYDDVLQVIAENGDTKKIYSLSLSSGLLSRYEIYENNELKRDVYIENLIIYN